MNDTTDIPKPKPLEGVRVLDCGTIIAAPYCATLLADWGADVIKIEHPDGDSLRRAGPSKNGAGLNYKFYGRNKRHMVLNLSTPEGQETFRKLALKSDIVVENFRPGVMERWNLGWEQLHALNPKLIMLRVTGFGQEGPYAGRAGFGTLAESMSGFAHINGYPDGPPTLPPFGLADGIAALSGAYAAMLALYHRDLRSGEGQMIDIALIEPIFHLLGGQPVIYDQTGAIQGRSGNRSVNNAPRNNYKTRDGRWLAISTAAQAIAERVMTLVGHPEVITEEWFKSGVGRAKHGDMLDGFVASWIAGRDAEVVLKAFEDVGAAVAPVYDVSQVFSDPQYRFLKSVVSVPDEELGAVRMQNLLFRMSGTPGEVRHAGRKLGQDTNEILREVLGTSDKRKDMDAVREMQVVPLGPLVGAEVKGVDVAAGLDERQMSFVRDALHRHGVVVLRDQKLQPKQQVVFARRLGKLRVSFLTHLAAPGQQELTVVSNIEKDGKPIGLVDAGALWHTDGSYLPRPDMYTVLYSLEIPHKDGKAQGDTLFLSTAAAFDRLPDVMRRRLAGARAVHSLSHHIVKKKEGNFRPPDVKDNKPDVEHPAIRTHPVTGRQCLYVTEGHTKAIAGLPDAESRALLQELFEHLQQADLVYRHKWRVGDLLIWDNCSTQHLAITDYGATPRRLHRAGVEGPVPV